MLSEDPSLAEIIQHGIDTAMRRVFKAGPGIVRAYDPITNTAFVAPATKHAFYDTEGARTFKELPEIPFVPVVFPRAGGCVLRLPVHAGDTVLLVYCDTSLAEFRESGDVSEPQDARHHSPGWPVAIPGFFANTDPMSPIDGAAASSAAIFGQDGGKQMRVGPLGIELSQAGVSPISPIALSIPTDAALAAVFPALTAIVAALNALITAYNGHVHPVPGVTTGPGATTSSVTTSTASAAGAAPSNPGTTASLLTRSL